MKTDNYFVNRDNHTTSLLRNIISILPQYCDMFFVAIESNTSKLTQLNYARDIKTFFNYLTLFKFTNKTIKEITLSELNILKPADIEKFLSYLNYYESNGKFYKNNNKAKARKLSALRCFFGYCFKHELIDKNIITIVDNPKIHEKEIVHLDVDEVVNMLNEVDNRIYQSKNQRAYNEHTKIRDSAIISLFLGTGIRISECVGLNINDIDFKTNAFTITRKGGNKTILYFSDEVSTSLLKYIEYRSNIKNLDPNEPALFLSLQKRRISIRAVENLVKKYAKVAAPLKKISPHKLRSTYGTTLYRETGDIYLVADVLGHKDVNTTKKHYAAISEDMRKSVINKVKLRDN